MPLNYGAKASEQPLSLGSQRDGKGVALQRGATLFLLPEEEGQFGAILGHSAQTKTYYLEASTGMSDHTRGIILELDSASLSHLGFH